MRAYLSAIVLENITKSFGNNVVLDNLNLDIKDQELIVVLGPSGCGKSTTLHIIAGLVKQDSGNVYLNGKLVDGSPPERRHVGLVFQDYMLFPHLSVFENVAFGLRTRGYTSHEASRVVDGKLKLLGIEDLKNRYPATLSLGQQQRVALARALAVEPEVLLLDEPFSNLDARVREYLRFEIRHMLKKKLGITTVMVTHDQVEAISMADRVAVLHNKRIEQVGKPSDVFFKPKTEFVAYFVGFENIYRGLVRSVSPEHGLAQVAINNLEIAATLDNDLSKGDRVLVSIRPDDIILMPRKNSTNTYNVFRGKIEEELFLGFSTRLKVSVEEDSSLSFIAVAPRHVVSELDLKPGKEVYVSFKPSAVNLISRKYCECEN